MKMEELVNKYIGSTGLGFPKSKIELDNFNKVYSNYSFSLSDEDIDPFKILYEVKRELANEQHQNNPKKGSLTKSQSFFRRLVLAAKIVDECHEQRRFGSVKFQKMVYLCEHASGMNFSTNYSKQAAGPFDNKFMHSVKSGFLKQRWFDVQRKREGRFYQVKFKSLDNVQSYNKYYENYYGHVKEDIDFLIGTFKKWYTDDVELVATIYECWYEINLEGRTFTKRIVIDKVYDWHLAKKKFSVQKITDTIDWMEAKGIYPKN